MQYLRFVCGNATALAGAEAKLKTMHEFQAAIVHESTRPKADRVFPVMPDESQIKPTYDQIIRQMKTEFENLCRWQPAKFKKEGMTRMKTSNSANKVSLTNSEVNYNCSRCGQKGHKGKDCPNRRNYSGRGHNKSWSAYSNSGCNGTSNSNACRGSGAGSKT